MKTYKNTLLLLVFALIFWGCDLGTGSDGNKEQPNVPTTPVAPPVPVKTYTITFHSNNGTNETTTQTVSEKESFILKGNTFKKDAFGFTGWSLVKDSETIDYTDLALSAPITSNINLYGNWEFGDTKKPSITKVIMESANLDITNSSQSAIFKVWASDDTVISSIEIELDGGVKGLKTKKVNKSDSSFDGFLTSGVFTIEITFPKGYENSNWRLSKITAKDTSYKETIFTPRFETKWNFFFNVSGKSDLTPPEITNVKLISESVVDTSTGDKVVSFEVCAEDDMEIKSLKYTFRNQTNSKWIQGEILASSSNYTGSETSGKFKVDVVVKESDSPGIWTLSSYVLYDVSGRSSQIWDSHSITNGWPYTFTKAGVADTGPATITDVRLLTPTVDTTNGDGIVKIEVDAEDDIELHYVTVQLRHISGAYEGKTIYTTFSEFSSIDNNKRGTFKFNVIMDQFNINGEWYIYKISLTDKTGNSAYYLQGELESKGYNTTFIKSGPQDLEKPKIISFDLLDPSLHNSDIDVSTEAKTISFKVNVSDDSDVESISISLHAPSALDNEYVRINSLTPGFNGSGEYVIDIVIPSDIRKAGVFYIYDIEVIDIAGKSQEYYKSSNDAFVYSLQKQGWDYYFNVTK